MQFEMLVPKGAVVSLSIGIVGLPNVGKSTLFTALTKKTGLAKLQTANSLFRFLTSRLLNIL